MSSSTLPASAAALRDAVREAYSKVATAPRAEHAFPVGTQFAVRVGYPPELLATLPPEACAAFAGVSNVALTAALEPGQAVLDLGCGSGLDAIIAAGRVGPSGRVTAVDFSEAMLERTRCAASLLGLAQLTAVHASGERLPFEDDSFDVALVNGIFNLNPDRSGVMRELARVLKPGGQLCAAELVLAMPVQRSESSSLAEWFS